MTERRQLSFQDEETLAKKSIAAHNQAARKVLKEVAERTWGKKTALLGLVGMQLKLKSRRDVLPTQSGNSDDLILARWQIWQESSHPSLPRDSWYTLELCYREGTSFFRLPSFIRYGTFGVQDEVVEPVETRGVGMEELSPLIEKMVRRGREQIMPPAWQRYMR
ncbi:hypothetical protein A2870_02650 [Candidatus Curtissbacteria bacterium RIFCSPHIGHO2_01_FULL_41_11]|uniref:Uncharacterized protein n=1 Tax=Candidatus Curtissbacteria bacterium RIFCSPHIGHO2_01_FULL_41_11 TaxID=1797711 RepID=A0A1F5G3U1_9BACT|nr:MAG: hypothetical protein A2870_02650 [Candidatus Curtissbacteria bacterium RIFCSPHIGHO2_01_FULL_41_11]